MIYAFVAVGVIARRGTLCVLGKGDGIQERVREEDGERRMRCPEIPDYSLLEDWRE